MKLIRWAVTHPYAVIAFYLGIIILAAGALWALPTRMMPYIQSPMIGIVTMAPGLSAREVETYISKVIEERMVDISRVRFIRSTSQPDFSMVSLEFWYGTDMKKALFEVQTLMAVVQADLPYDRANLKPSWVLPIDPLNLPVLRLALTAPGWDPVRLREYADNTMVNRLKTAEGVWSVYAFGGLKRQAQVIVDRTKLAAYGFSILDVKGALDLSNVDKSAGTLTDRGREIIARLEDRALTGHDLAGTVLGRTPDGRVVYVGNVARTLDTFKERRSLYRYNGRDAVEINVIQNPDGSSPRTIAAVMQQVARLQAETPGLHVDVSYDNSHFVNIVRNNALEELGIGILLTGLFILLFLGEWRGTLIALTTIPTSLGIAFILMWASGMSFNSSTLIGLLLAIGRLVDDSIIDLHSIGRHLRMGKSPEEAAVDGSTEVRTAVIAATFMICLALVPLLLCGGIVQEMFAGIIWPFMFALLASLLVSLTLTPLLASRLYPQADPNRPPDRVQRLLAPWERMLQSLETRYRGWLAWALSHRGIVMAVVIGVIALGVGLFPAVGSEMMPLADTGQAYVTLEAEPGTSLTGTSRMAAQVERLLLQHPGVQAVSSEVGFEPGGTYFSGYGMGGVNTAAMMVTFADKEDRPEDIWRIVDEVHHQAMTTIPGLRRLSLKEMGADVMASAMAPVQLIIYGKDLATLSWMAEETLKIAQHTPGLVQAATSWIYGQPEVRVVVDRVRAAVLGLSPAQVAEQAYYAMNGGLTTEFFNPQGIRKSTVLVRYPQNERRNAEDLARMTLTTTSGRQVSLSSAAALVSGKGPTLIERDNLRRVVSVTGYYRKGGPDEMALTMNLMMQAMNQLPWPPGYGMEMRGDMTQMTDSFHRMLLGFCLALLFIYLSLVAQFRSLTQPLTMLMAIPLELAGVFGALLLAHQTISTVSLLGVIILNGMDVTTSILLIDLVMRRREEGHSREAAILDAGPIRLRPILMTTIITLAVLAPVAFFPRTGMDAYSPLATVVIGGLSLSTLLTLVAIPVMFSLVDDATQWVRRWLGRRRRPAATTVVALMVTAGLLLAAHPAWAAPEPSPSPVTAVTPSPLSTYTITPGASGARPLVSGPMTAQDAVVLARQYNFDLAIWGAEAAAAAAQARQAAGESRPALSTTTYATTQNTMNITTSAPGVQPSNIMGLPTGDTADQNLTLMVPLDLSGRLGAGIRQARASAAAAQADLKARAIALAAAAKTAFYQAQAGEQGVEIWKAAVAAQRETVALTRQLVAVGKTPRLGLLRAQAEEAAAEQAEAQAEQDAGIALVALKRILGISQESNLQLVDTVQETWVAPSLQEAVSQAQARRFELAAAKESVAAAEAAVAAAEGAYGPSAGLNGMYDVRTPQQTGFTDGYSVGLVISMPLWDGGQRRAGVEGAQARLEAARLEEGRVREAITAEVASAIQELMGASRRSDLAEAAVAAAVEQLRVARLRFEAGKSIQLEILDAVRVVTDARVRLLRARYDLSTAAARLAAALGRAD